MIICYGDSNTWGYNPLKPNTRYRIQEIYTSILKEKLIKNTSTSAKVLNRGLPARCATSEIVEPYKDGYTPFKQEFSNYKKEVDLFIIMLGTNDVKLSRDAHTISLDIKKLIDIIIYNEKIKNILIISPSPIKKLDYANLPANQIPSEVFYNNDDQVIESKKLAKELQNLCNTYDNHKITFLNGGNLWTTSEQDGIHLEPNEHHKVAEEIYNLCITKKII